MNHNKKINDRSTTISKWVMLVAATLCFFSCEKLIEVPIPTSQLSSGLVFEDVTTANAAVASLYIKMRNEVLLTGTGNGLSICMGSNADEIEVYGTPGSAEMYFYLNNVLPTHEFVSSFWSGAYNLIYAANSIVERLGTSVNISVADKNRLTGEALFVRAYIHHYLVNLFGDIPYASTTDYRLNAKISKLPQEQIIDLIIVDLQQAAALLADEYPTAQRVRPNKSVANAMLARVYLYSRQWQKAADAAEAVISRTGLYQWVDELDKVFLNNSTGTLWQFMPAEAGFNTLEGNEFIFESTPPVNRSLSMALIESFENNDQRKTHWVGSVTDGMETWYYPHKYRQRFPTATSVEYSILFRLEELYLIRAEALAYLGQYQDSRNDINKIRSRAGLVDIEVATESELITAVLHERQIELFTEHGHRWFDLKRTQRADQVLSPVKPGWTSTDTLMPLPDKEILLNPNLLPQNAGFD